SGRAPRNPGCPSVASRNIDYVLQSPPPVVLQTISAVDRKTLANSATPLLPPKAAQLQKLWARLWFVLAQTIRQPILDRPFNGIPRLGRCYVATFRMSKRQ